MNNNGYIPPQAVEAEELLIGTCMLYKEAVVSALELLQPDEFYKDCNSVIFEAIKQINNENNEVDMLSVIQKLKKNGNFERSGGAYYISRLTTNVVKNTVEYEALLIKEKSIQRKLILLGTELVNKAYDQTTDCFENIEFVEKGISEVSKNVNIGNIDTIKNLWDKVSQRNINLIETNKGGQFLGVTSGYRNLDLITGGWQAPDLIILAARPSMGKTSLAVNFMRNASIFDIPVLLFSLEMSSLQIAMRAFSLESEIPINEFMRKGVSIDNMLTIEKGCSKFINSEFYVDDTASISLIELKRKARKLKREKDIKLIVIDYLQLMTTGEKNKGNREQEISTISRGLKQIAKELNVPIIALSQLSRDAEKRGNGSRPKLSDLRESGAIEQDADIVIFIHRPEYYGITENENGESTAGLAEIIYAKNRNGAIGTENLKFVDYLMKFKSNEQEALYNPNSDAIKHYHGDNAF